jgi:hypothetical protein
MRTTRTTRIKGRALGAMLAIALGLVATPAPASASGTQITHGRDLAQTESDNLWGMVCDLERDGHAVYAIWDLLAPYGVAAEADSFDRGCDRPPSFPQRSFRFRLCERRAGNDSCTSWRRTL